MKKLLALFLALTLLIGMLPMSLADDLATPTDLAEEIEVPGEEEPDLPEETEDPEVPAEPTEAPALPTEAPAEPTEEPAEPSEEPAEPTEEPAEPSEEPAEPSEEPAEPTEEPVEPTEEPVEPTEEPVEEPAVVDPAVLSLEVTEVVASGSTFVVKAVVAGAEKALLVVDDMIFPAIDTVGKTNDEIAEAMLDAAKTVSEEGTVTISANTGDLFIGEHTVSLKLWTGTAWTNAMGSATFMVCKDDPTSSGKRVIYGSNSVAVHGKDIYISVYSTEKIYLSSEYAKITYRTNYLYLSKTSDYKSFNMRALKTGNTKITIYWTNGKKDNYDVHIVKDMSVAVGITLGLSGTYEMAAGSTKTIPYSVIPSTATKNATFTSSKSNIASVTSSGKVTAISEGTATITAKLANGKSAKLKIKVYDPYKPSSVAIRQGKSYTVLANSTFTLTPVLSPSTARCSAYTWKSSNKKVISVDSNGYLHALSEGSSKITVTTHNGKSATCTVTVVDPYKPAKFTLKVDGKVVSADNVTFERSMYASLRLTYNVVSYGGDDYPTPASYMTWSTSSKSIAEIAPNGAVTVKKAGTVTFTLKSKTGLTAKIKFKFTKDPAVLTAISLGTTSVQMGTGETKTLTPTLTPSTAVVNLEWSSSKPAVATVNNSGKVTAVATGTTVITVKDKNSNLQASISVVVSVKPVYRAVVSVEATDLAWDYNGVTCYGYSTRQSDYDGIMTMLGKQSYNGSKWSIKGLHTTSASTVLNALTDLAGKATANDVSLFFFMGHGSPDGTLCFYNDTYITPATLKKYLDKIPGKVIVLIGSCFSGNYIAKGASGASFTHSIISTFGKGETIPVTYTDESGKVTEVTPEMLVTEEDEGYSPRKGELRASKYYVLTAAAADEEGTSSYGVTWYPSKAYVAINESKSFTYFVRGVCRAGGWEIIDRTNTSFTSGTVTLAKAYQTTYNYCMSPTNVNSRSTVQVYPSNSSFVIFSR